MNQKEDKLILGGHEFTSRFILGSGKFSLDLVKACIEKAGAQIITLALRRANEGGLANILDYIPDNITLLPNTSGARNAEEAVRIARLSREIGCGDFVKLEVIHDSKYRDNQGYGNPCKRRFHCHALYVPGLKCCQGLSKCGSLLHHASWRSHRLQ